MDKKKLIMFKSLNLDLSKSLFWVLHLGGWGAFTLLNLAGRQYFIHFNYVELINSLVLGLSLILASYGLRKYYQKYFDVQNMLAGSLHIFLGSLLASLFSMLIYALIIVPNQSYLFKVEHTELIQQIILSFPVLFILMVAWSAFYAGFKKQQQLKAAQQKQQVLTESLKSAQLDVLLSQINPHFLFNAINNIRALILEDSMKARDMLANLSQVMRHTMQIDRSQVINFNDEIAVVEQYIALNKLQFENKLNVQYDIDPSTKMLPLPPMILQLLVENAIKHGISKLKHGGEVLINSAIVDEQWLITVENSGELLANQSKPTHTGIGINNIKQRLALMYGDKSTLSLASSSIGVKATITIPLNN